jgi:hypothetical protein
VLQYLIPGVLQQQADVPLAFNLPFQCRSRLGLPVQTPVTQAAAVRTPDDHRPAEPPGARWPPARPDLARTGP